MEVKEETQEERKEREKKEYMKAWREANKDKVAKNGKKYYESNKEKILEKKKEYYESNKEKISETRREKYFRKKQEIEAHAKQFQQPLWEKTIDIINELKGNKVSPKKRNQSKKEFVLQFQKEYKETHNIDVSKKSKEWLAKNPEYKKAWITFNANKTLKKKVTVPFVVEVAPPVIDNSLIEIAFLKEQLAQMQLELAKKVVPVEATKPVPEIVENKEKRNWITEKRFNNLEFIPREFKTRELCEKAVQDYGIMLEFVPEELKTKELCELALKSRGRALEFVPEDLKTQEMCEYAVEKDGYYLESWWLGKNMIYI